MSLPNWHHPCETFLIFMSPHSAPYYYVPNRLHTTCPSSHLCAGKSFSNGITTHVLIIFVLFIFGSTSTRIIMKRLLIMHVGPVPCPFHLQRGCFGCQQRFQLSSPVTQFVTQKLSTTPYFSLSTVMPSCANSPWHLHLNSALAALP